MHKDCKFYQANDLGIFRKCGALTVKACKAKCGFYKTEAEFYESETRAARSLADRGLKRELSEPNNLPNYITAVPIKCEELESCG